MPTNDSIGESLQKTMIWAPQSTRLQSSFVAFRKKLSVCVAPRAAMLHVFADVRYMLWVNGRFVLCGPARFEPSGPEYDSMNIARFLQPGENSVVVLVMSNASNGKMRGHEPGLTVRLDVDGTTALSSDETWKWSDQTRYKDPEVDWGNVHDRIDARREDGDWTQPDYDDSGWGMAAKIAGDLWGPLSARRIPLLRETQIEVRFADGQTLPFTLMAGQKLTFSTEKLVQAYTVLELDAEEGSEILLDYAHIEYIARAGWQTYISSDTHSVFGGSISLQSGLATIVGLKLVERLYPFDVVGSFQSNDPMLNRLWEMCARSAQVLSEDAYVDCADRERTEWMDNDPPAFAVTRTALAGVGSDGEKIYADARLLGALLRRTALTQQPEGWVKAHTASDRFDTHAHMEDRACNWIEGARRYYQSSEDSTIVREIWPVIVGQMNYFLERRTPRGLVLGREWEVWGNPLSYITCEGAGLNAFVYQALVDAAYLGQIIGEQEQAATFERRAENLSTAFNRVLWDEEHGTYFSGYSAEEAKTQADLNERGVNLKVANNLIAPTMIAALLALDQGIVPETRRQSVARYLFANRTQADRIMMLYYLFRQMYEADTPDFDREVLTTLRSKWKDMAEWPWQTSWEEFIGSSKAHIYGMFPGYFLSAYVLGVRPEGPVWNHRVLIEPRLGDLTDAQGLVATEHGPVFVAWKVEKGEMTFHVDVPNGVDAALHVPRIGDNSRLLLDGKTAAHKVKGRYFIAEIGSGSHQGTITFTQPTLLAPVGEVSTTPITGKPVVGERIK